MAVTSALATKRESYGYAILDTVIIDLLFCEFDERSFDPNRTIKVTIE